MVLLARGRCRVRLRVGLRFHVHLDRRDDDRDVDHRAEAASVPVINGLTKLATQCQEQANEPPAGEDDDAESVSDG